MKLSQLKAALLKFPGHELRFVLPDGRLIEKHAHITEVGRIDKAFIDCGGTIRRATHCALQAWVADDVDHRLVPGRLAAIIALAAPVLGDDDLDVEVEYQDGLISQFPLESVSAVEGALLLNLTTKHTDCLAKELCGVPSAGDECGASTGCC